LAVALDGGGGALRWAAWRGGHQVANGELPGAVRQLLGWEKYSARLAEAIKTAALHAEGEPREILMLGMGLSGVDRTEEIQQIYDWFRREYPAVTHCWAGNDAWPALRAGAGRLHGILLIAGTGSICLGATQRASGEVVHVRVGGWGNLLDDVGSAYWF